ncbi:MAG: glycosyltransferase family 2 protein [Bacteroidales bacterium]|nr:glycosyltransferase family 2 protein [Bacteroidales bacterium]
MEKEASSNNVDFSVIIPQRNSIQTLPRLFNSIPVSDRIEIIVVDNTPTPVTKEEIGVERDYKLLWSEPSRHAGGARNVGLEAATGKWLIFSDADDYFTEGAFDLFQKQLNTQADIVFFKSTGIYTDTGEYSDRAEPYSKMIIDYLEKEDELSLRIKHIVPWAKMIRHSLVKENSITFDEVRAANDAMFATKAGLLAKSISAIDADAYVVTVSSGSLTKRRDFEVLHSRYLVALRRNQLLKSEKLGKHQAMVIHFLYQSREYGFSKLWMMLKEAWQYKQNIFINTQKLFPGFKRFLKNERKNAKYIVK